MRKIKKYSFLISSIEIIMRAMFISLMAEKYQRLKNE